MKRIVLIITMIAITHYGSTASIASSVPGELLVKYKPGAYPENLQGELAKIGWAKIKIAKSKGMSQATMALKKNPDIICVEPNYYGEFLSEPNDPDLDQQWHLDNIEAPDAWDKSLGKGVIIGLIDSGVDLDHEDLADNILTDGWDFGDNDDDPTDELGHGTQVCGVIAAIQNNNLGISGIAPECKILPLKVNVGGLNEIEDSNAAEAIIYAADHGANIINLSLGWPEGEIPVITDAIDYAADKGVLLVAAAGQDVGGPVLFPANLEEVIAVSGTNEDSNFWFKSNQGPEIELSAPGINIYTTTLGGGYVTRSGTSFSSPMVSAIAALLASKYPHLNRNQIREYLITSADDLGDAGKDDFYGYGKVNALKTLGPIVTLVFPDTISGSKNIPMIYLLAIFSEGSNFAPFISEVSFESANITPLGSPLVFLPAFLLQMVIVENNPSEGCSNITVTTGTETVNGYDVLTIELLPWNL